MHDPEHFHEGICMCECKECQGVDEDPFGPWYVYCICTAGCDVEKCGLHR